MNKHINKFIFAHPETGYYFKKANEKLILCTPADLKALPLEEVQDPTQRFVCYTKEGKMVYALQLKEAPKGSQFHRLTDLNQCTWETYFALTCLEAKISLVRIAKANPESVSAVYACLSQIEKVFSRGKGKSWTTTDKKESDILQTDGEKSLDENQS